MAGPSHTVHGQFEGDGITDKVVVEFTVNGLREFLDAVNRAGLTTEEGHPVHCFVHEVRPGVVHMVSAIWEPPPAL